MSFLRAPLWTAAALGLCLGCSSSSSDAPALSPEAGADSSAPEAGLDSSSSQDAAPPSDGSFSDQQSLQEASSSTDGQVEPQTDCARLQELRGSLQRASSDSDKQVLLDTFVTEIQNSKGFPIRCDQSVTFLFQSPQGFGPPSIAGDFNSYDPAANRMQAVADGYYWADVIVPEQHQRFQYKFTDGNQWVADPLARRFGYDEYGEYSLVSGGLEKGHLERLGPVQGAGLRARPLTMYLPPGYEASSDSYPVLYAHDGQNLFDPSAIWGSWKLDQAIEGLLASGQARPFIVVGIHNTQVRMDEYTQVPDIIEGQACGGKADAYYELITQTVMPLVAQHYRVLTGPQNTWTMGSSLGGLISLYYGMRHPDVFGRVAGLSSTVGWGSLTEHNQTLIDLLPTLQKPNAVFYLDSGGGPGPGGCVDSDGDGIQDDDLEADDNYCENIQLRDEFVAQGFAFEVDLFHWHEPGAEHNEAAWAARVFRPLSILAKP